MSNRCEALRQEIAEAERFHRLAQQWRRETLAVWLREEGWTQDDWGNWYPPGTVETDDAAHAAYG